MSKFNAKEFYINRELSWLAFNERVLEEAADSSNPLFERLKFVSIYCSNLDEFFMVRVAGLKDQEKNGYNKPENKEQMTPRQQLKAISKRVHKGMKRLEQILQEMIYPQLQEEGIIFLGPQELNQEQRRFIKHYYHHYIFPVLTPMAVDASHPFPLLANKSLNLGILLEAEEDEKHRKLFAVVQVPAVLPRFIELPGSDGQRAFILLEDVISEHIATLFQGNRILESGYFRITRDAELELNEETAKDLLEEIEEELKKRKMGAAVRLEVASGISGTLKETLRESLELDKEDVYTYDVPLDLTFFMKFSTLPGYDHLRFEEIKPQPPQDLIGENEIFSAIANKDIMVHHPYESFDPVVHFIRQAAEDPQVLAIKQTLYRVSGHSPIVAALAQAAENGKQVTVLLEIKARFDEENNISWARKLEKAGCHVIYGLVGLKTHSKITLVVRREGDQIRRYVHLSTGNYNDATARVYTDIGMFTAREEFGYDASAFFNHLTGYATIPKWKQIVIAPRGMKEKFCDLIDNEIAKSTPENPGYIIAKMNALTHKDLIKKLFQASCAGVKIDLIVRGICCLRPGIPGVSENIRVFSIIGRFLEHSRIFYFKNGGDELLFLSSADWMTRNLQNRVEILFPVVQDNLKERLKNILHVQLNDNTKRHELHADGTYTKVPAEGEVSLDSQLFFYQEAQRVARNKGSLTQFTPRTHV